MQFDRYLLAQLMRTTLSVAVTLIGIVWLFQTIRILEIVVNRGAPITDFFVMSVTVVPLWLTIALPISAFVAVTWVFQRALADRELRDAGQRPKFISTGARTACVGCNSDPHF